MSKTSNTSKRIMAVFVIGLCVILAIIVIFTRMHDTALEPSVLFISSSEANEKINEHQDAFILDVRTREEFGASRVPGSINIPYTMIEAMKDLLPENRQNPIFVYCRTGRRARFAANELLDLGYTNIIVFPGMNTWVYETVSG